MLSVGPYLPCCCWPTDTAACISFTSVAAELVETLVSGKRSAFGGDLIPGPAPAAVEHAFTDGGASIRRSFVWWVSTPLQRLCGDVLIEHSSRSRPSWRYYSLRKDENNMPPAGIPSRRLSPSQRATASLEERESREGIGRWCPRTSVSWASIFQWTQLPHVRRQAGTWERRCPLNH